MRYLFIDGSYLRKEYENCLTHFVGSVTPLDLSAVKDSFAARKVFYYDGFDEPLTGELPADYETRIAPIRERHKQIRSIPGFHVFEGSIRGRRGNRRQKQVDVQLTVDALTHAFRKNADEIVLIAGDLDFEPLVAALIQLGTYVTVVAVPDSVSEEFKFSGDHYQPLGVDRLLTFGGASLRKQFPIPEEFGVAYKTILTASAQKQVAKGSQGVNKVLLLEDIDSARTVPHFRLLIIPPDNIQARIWEHRNGEFLKTFVSSYVPDIVWN